MSKKWVFLSQFIPYNFIFAITGYVWKEKQFDISIDIRMYSKKFKCNVKHAFNLILTVPYKATIKVHVMIENKSFKISNSKFIAINCQV